MLRILARPLVFLPPLPFYPSLTFDSTLSSNPSAGFSLPSFCCCPQVFLVKTYSLPFGFVVTVYFLKLKMLMT